MDISGLFLLLSVVVERMAVFQAGLGVVTLPAQRLPVPWIPEQSDITAMRLYVIDANSLRITSVLHAFFAQWVCLQEASAFPLPRLTVTAAGSGA